VQAQTRELDSVIEGGMPQALEVAISTTAAARMGELSAEQQSAVQEAITRAIEPMVRDDGVHLTSVSNIASGRCGE
jgi:hypothetical protein